MQYNRWCYIGILYRKLIEEDYECKRISWVEKIPFLCVEWILIFWDCKEETLCQKSLHRAIHGIPYGFQYQFTFSRKKNDWSRDKKWWHILFQDFCIFCSQYLGRLWYAKFFSEPLATIKQYRISFNRKSMVINEHSIREGHLWQLSP